MDKVKSHNTFVQTLKVGFRKQMPRIQKEIEIYESHLKKGKLNRNPKIAPQFNS